MSKIKLVQVNRSQLFFDQYEFSVNANILEAGCLRANSIAELHKAISYRNIARQRWSSFRDIIGGEVVTNLNDMWHRLDAVRDKIKLVISFNRVYIYSNDLALLQQLVSPSYVTIPWYQQACVAFPRGVVLKKDPKFKLRSYFKDKTLTQEQFDKLRDFITSRDDCYGITKSLKGNLKYARWPYLHRHWFVEHNDLKDITMLSLVCPGVIRKTLDVQAK